MIKKITLTLVIAVSLVTTFVGCSSDDSSEEQQNSNYSYNINPPSWLVGHHWQWLGAGQDDYVMFTLDNIIAFSSSWKDLYQGARDTHSHYFAYSAKFYEKSNTSTYYEAEYTLNNIVEDNIEVEKISSTSIKVTLNRYWEDSSGKDSLKIIRVYNKID